MAGLIALLYIGLVVVLNAACPAFWDRPAALLFVAVFAASALAIVYVAFRPTPRSRTLVQLASGVIAGIGIQPSSAAVIALLTAGLSLGSAPRRSFIVSLVLLLVGIAAGWLVLTATSGPAARC